MSFKESIKQMAESQKMTIGFYYLDAEAWLDVFDEWLADNTSDDFGDWLSDKKHKKAMFVLFMEKVGQDYDQVAEELESEGVRFYDHMTDKEARQ